MHKSVARLLIVVAGLLLVMTGLAKLISQSGSSTLLNANDPIFPLTIRQVLLAVGVIEVVIGIICIKSPRHYLSTVLVAWFATAVVIYRLGMWWVGYRKPCSCIGGITDPLGISPDTAENIAKGILAHLLLTGYGLLLLSIRRNRQVLPKPSLVHA
jgi:hypothetical protein